MVFRPDLSWEFLSKDEIATRSIKAVRNHVEHLKGVSEYYKGVLADIDPSDINSPEDIAKLPLTDRETLVNNFKTFRAIPYEQIVETVVTRGLTGVPLLFILSQGDLDRLSFNGALAFNALGLTPEDRAQILLTLDGLLLAGMAYYRGLTALGINTLRVGHIPFDKQKPAVASGIRLGTPAATTRGMGESEMKKIAELIDKVLTNASNVKVIESVKKEVNDMLKKFPLYKI